MKHVLLLLIASLLLVFCFFLSQDHTADVYECYANSFYHDSRDLHQLPIRDICGYNQPPKSYSRFHQLPTEYPVLSIVPFSIPLLFPYIPYKTLFMLEMLIVFIVTYIFLFRRGGKRSIYLFVIWTILGTMSLVLNRFDPIVGLLILIALDATTSKKYTAGYISLALATLLKLFPVLLVPLIILSERKRQSQGLYMFVGIIFVGFLLAYLLDPISAISPLLFYRNRPIEIESVLGSIIWILSAKLHILSATVENSYQSVSYTLPPYQKYIETILSVLSTFMLVVGSALTYRGYVRKRIGITDAFIIIILVSIIANKVLSTQYFLWLIPVLAYRYKNDKSLFLTWSIMFALTALVFPVLWHSSRWFKNNEILLYPAILVRNLMLVLITYLFVRGAPAAQKKH